MDNAANDDQYGPSWVLDMPNDEYHKRPQPGSSRLKEMLTGTPAAYLHKTLNPEPAKSNDAYTLGTLAHLLLMQPQLADSEVAVTPGFDRRTKQGKADAEAFDIANKGKLIVTLDMWDAAVQMALNAVHHPKVAALMDGAVFESSVFFEHKPTEQLFKVRPDWLPLGRPFIVDVKTTTDASWSGMQRSIMNYHYDLSAAMYIEGCNSNAELLDRMQVQRYEGFVLLCIEKEPPYQVALYEISPEYLQIGHGKFLLAAQRYADAMKNNFPSYPQTIRVIEPPPWAGKLLEI